jgi:hypothetical protein
MPFGQPGSLDKASYVKAVAFLLYSNGATPGTVALPLDAGALKSFTIPTTAGQATRSRAVAIAGQATPQSGSALTEQEQLSQGALTRKVDIMSPQAVAKLSALIPVTDSVLRSPPADDWLIWRCTYNKPGP